MLLLHIWTIDGAKLSIIPFALQFSVANAHTRFAISWALNLPTAPVVLDFDGNSLWNRDSQNLVVEKNEVKKRLPIRSLP